MNKSKILIGVAVGAAVGTAIGALIAPAKGSASRKKLMQKGTEVTKKTKKKIAKYSDTMTKKYDAIKKSAQNLAENGKKKAKKFTSKKIIM